jgi:hypothetical protein
MLYYNPNGPIPTPVKLKGYVVKKLHQNKLYILEAVLPHTIE